MQTLTGGERSAFKRAAVQPAIRALNDCRWEPTDVVAMLSAVLPYLDPGERAEVVAAVVAKGEYYPFRDGLHWSDVVKAGHAIDAKSVQFEFVYRSRSESAIRQATAYDQSKDLPGLFVVYQGKRKDHRIVYLPGLLRRNVAVTLNRVVKETVKWTWKKEKPQGILIAQDEGDIVAFLSDPIHAQNALTQMEAAMTVATTAFKDDPKMRQDLDDISEEVLSAAMKTPFGKRYIADKEAKAREEIYRKLLSVMSEEEARKMTGYLGK